MRSLILAALPKTLLLVGTSTTFALLVAIPLGVFQTVRRNKPSDYALTSMAFIFYATPPFVLGPLLVLFLAVDNHIFLPYVPPGDSIGQLATDWHAMVLPVFTLAAVTIAAFSRYMRSSMMDAMTQDYVRTARAKGASRSRVLFRHAFRNALIPIITLLGLSIPAIVSGAVITETVFNYPGMGFLTTRAAEQFDLGTVVERRSWPRSPLSSGHWSLTSSTQSWTRGSAMSAGDMPGSAGRDLLSGTSRTAVVPPGELESTGPQASFEDSGRADGTSAPSGGEATQTGSIGRLVLRVFLENKLALVGVAILVLMTGFCFLGPLFYHTNQSYANLDTFTLPPSGQFPLGTDGNGFDVLGRLMKAGQPRSRSASRPP